MKTCVERLLLAVCVAMLCLVIGCAGSGGSSPVPAPAPSPSPSPTPSPVAPPQGITAVNHVIVLTQENRSFDHYFGQMTAYRKANGIPINGAPATINDLSAGSFSNVSPVSGPIAPYHTGSVCTEDLTPDWTETHKTFNRRNPAAAGPGSPMDGFVALAYERGLYASSLGVHMADQNGHRAIGFFDASDLNYYYFIASQFGMSDNMFGPVPTETPSARAYSYAATSQGHLHDIAPGTLTAKTIFESLDQKGISWKLYAAEGPSAAFLKEFAYFNKPGVSAHIASVDQYRSDAQAGTLPNVAFIETGLHIGISEHTSNFDPAHPELGMVPINVQTGQAWAGGLINALLTSPNWKDSVMFFVYDESGGLFDHVPPLAVVSPDGVKPVDFRPNDVPGDFTITGGRVPNAVISPFSKKNYVSHTAADYTAFLKFIEARWGLPPLTARDASMPDMTEFFDFTGKPWATPPAPPTPSTAGACDFTKE